MKAIKAGEGSHAISKPKPKPNIKIVQIYAPEIIKTDVASFRDLVQRLTGKPPAAAGGKNVAKPRAEAEDASPLGLLDDDDVGDGVGFLQEMLPLTSSHYMDFIGA